MTQLRVASEMREHCGSFGGCATYVSVIAVGETQADEIDLDGRDPAGPRLPAVIAPGSYIVRFRLAAVSDALTAGLPPDEHTLATCDVPINVTDQAAVDIHATFDARTCEASAAYS